MKSFENCAQSLQFPRITVDFVFTADAEVVKPDMFAVLVVTCEKTAVTSHSLLLLPFKLLPVMLLKFYILTKKFQ